MPAPLKRLPFIWLCASLATLLSLDSLAREAPKVAELPPLKLVAGSQAAPTASVAQRHKVMEALRLDTRQPEFSPVKLEPVGGVIDLPRGWLLYEQHSASGYRWMVSMAPPSERERGEARMTLLLIPQVSKLEKMKPSVLAASQVVELTQGHPELKACQPVRQGIFVKVCYDVELEADSVFVPKYRAMVSMYYSDESDLFAMTIFSAPPAKFGDYQSIRERLDKVEFFGRPPALSAGKASR